MTLFPQVGVMLSVKDLPACLRHTPCNAEQHSSYCFKGRF